MTTPLQQAAKALINRWDSTDWKDTPHTAHYIEELRKALDAEIARGNYAEGVEYNRLCDALTFMGVAGPKSMEELAFNMSDSVNRLTRAVITLKNKHELAQTETGTRNLRVTEIAQSVEPYAVFHGRVDSGEHGAFNLDLLKMIPRGAYLYLHPPQPQATTAVPEGLLEAIRLSGHTLVKTKFGYRIIDAGTVTAQGEKP